MPALRRPTATVRLARAFATPCVLALAAPSTAAAQDNILVVVADDLGIDQLASYGVGLDLPNTPTLDALAQSGILFRNAYANPTCSPSRASLQTGRHPFRTGVGAGVDETTTALPPWETTIPEMLDAGGSGYAHAAFGKWHLGNSSVGGKLAPNLAGYGHYSGVLGNLGPGTDKYFVYKKVTDGVATQGTSYLTSDEVDDAIAWIDAQTGPWFCYLAFHAPHQPFHAPPAALHTVDLAGLDPPTVQPRPYYRAMVEALDTELGRLLAALGPELDDTWVFFLGDNGTPVAATVPPFDPLHAKGTVFDGGVHVPLIVRKTDTVPPGSECEALVGITDLFATVADIAGVSPDVVAPFGSSSIGAGFPGTSGTGRSSLAPPYTAPVAPVLDTVSLVPYLVAPDFPSLREVVMSERFELDGALESYRTIREARYKYQVERRPAGVDEIRLFDLQNDPFETVNLLQRPPLSPPAARVQGLLASALQALLDS